MKRAGSGECSLCGVWRQSLHNDHIKPKFKGGGDEPANIQKICANCHEDKTREDLRGVPLSALARLAQSKAQTGKKRPQTGAAISAGLRAYYQEPTHRAWLNEMMKNRPPRTDRYRCDACGLVTMAGPMGTHQKAKKHEGKTLVESS